MARFIPQYMQDYILDEIAESDEQAMCTTEPTTYFQAVRGILWVQSNAFIAGQVVYPPTSNGKVYECTVGGTTGGVEPGWGTSQDQTFTDGTVTWKTHTNYALVNRALIPADFSKSVGSTAGSRKLTLTEKQGVVTHTAGIITHCALICSTDRSLRFVSLAQTTIGGNEVESGRTTIFYSMNITVPQPVAS